MILNRKQRNPPAHRDRANNGGGSVQGIALFRLAQFSITQRIESQTYSWADVVGRMLKGGD
jgi:hypothetical protein